MEPVDPDTPSSRIPLTVATQATRDLCRDLLIMIGEDPDREGLKDTPRRWAQFWHDFMNYDPGPIDTNFASIHVDQVVVVSGINVWSLCEHHLLPFSCRLTVGYLTTDRVIGLSKIARICHLHAHRLQLQERLVNEIADTVQEKTGSDSVAVVGSGRHLCMEMRGVKTPSTMTTSVMRGVFLTKPEARSEFLRFHLNGTG